MTPLYCHSITVVNHDLMYQYPHPNQSFRTQCESVREHTGWGSIRVQMAPDTLSSLVEESVSGFLGYLATPQALPTERIARQLCYQFDGLKVLVQEDITVGAGVLVFTKEKP